MLTLQLDLTKPQARALSHLVLQVPAHSLREWAGSDEEAEAMRQALDTIRKALIDHGIQSP
jgi:adenosine deaminase